MKNGAEGLILILGPVIIVAYLILTWWNKSDHHRRGTDILVDELRDLIKSLGPRHQMVTSFVEAHNDNTRFLNEANTILCQETFRTVNTTDAIIDLIPIGYQADFAHLVDTGIAPPSLSILIQQDEYYRSAYFRMLELLA